MKLSPSRPRPTTVRHHQHHASDQPRRLPRGALVALLATVAGVALLAGWVAWRMHVRNRPPPELIPEVLPERERLALQRTAGRVMGEHLAARYPGREVLVLLSPPVLRDAAENAALEGLVEVARGQVKLVYRALELSPEQKPIPGLWLTAPLFDDAVASRPDCGIVLSLVGLPNRPAAMKFWGLPERPDLLLLNAPVFLLQKLVASGAIDALLVRRPGGAAAPNLPVESPDNWLLITPENVAAIAETYHGMFVTPQD